MARALTSGEIALARRVFGDAIRLARVRLHGGGFGPFALTLGSRIFLPPSMVADDLASADAHSRALLIHELVHVWQFQTRPLWTLASWARTMLTGGYGPGLPGYRYELPLGPFQRLNLEQQASVVEQAFLIGLGLRSGRMAWGLTAADLRNAPFPV